jgi:hypothetical protein
LHRPNGEFICLKWGKVCAANWETPPSARFGGEPAIRTHAASMLPASTLQRKYWTMSGNARQAATCLPAVHPPEEDRAASGICTRCSHFCAQPEREEKLTLRLCFSNLCSDQIDRGLLRLRRAVNELAA